MSKIKSAYWDTLNSLDYELQELPDNYCDKLLAKQMSNQQYLKERLKPLRRAFQRSGNTKVLQS